MTRDIKDLIVALDIGTSKVVAVVAEILPEGRFEVLGLGQHESSGMRKGVVVNIEATVTAIQRALEEAELMADCKIRDVYTGIAGSHIRSFNSSGMVAVKDKEVTAADVARVIETAKAVNIPTDQQVLHILTQEYVIDGQEDVRQPHGMSGMKLEVKVHIVTGAIAAAQNIVKCIKRCGLEVSELVLQPLASSMAVLTDDEKELGVCLVDIGGGTTDIAVLRHGSIRHTAVIPIAGDQINNDIAVAFRTPLPSAEEIKIKHGYAARSLASASEQIEIPVVDGKESKTISTLSLAEVIEARLVELYELVAYELKRSGMEDMIASGIVITGGSSLMKGMVNLGESVFRMPVRIGTPRNVGGLSEVVDNPRYSTGIGLLLMGKGQLEKEMMNQIDGNSINQIFMKMKNWFQGNF